MSEGNAMISALRRQLASVLADKEQTIEQVLIALLAGGHLLIEDIPGIGKTTLAHALAASLDTDFGRIQFTADLLPADIIGVEIFDPAEQAFVFHPGAIFHHIVLAALHVSEALLDYVLLLLESSRNGEWLKQGVSPRAGRDLIQAARAHAWLAGQSYVTAADVQAVWLPCLAHSIVDPCFQTIN